MHRVMSTQETADKPWEEETVDAVRVSAGEMAAIGEQSKKRQLRQYVPLRFEPPKTGCSVESRFIWRERIMARKKSAAKSGNGDLEFADRLWSAANRYGAR